jgi:hypothetical protein
MSDNNNNHAGEEGDEELGDLYDEFGNYIGPELDDDDEESSSGAASSTRTKKKITVVIVN